MQETIAKQTGDPRELLRLAELRARGYSGQATGIGTSGFSSGGGTTQGVAVNGKSSAFQSANSPKVHDGFNESGLMPSAYGDTGTTQTPEQVTQVKKPAIALDVSKNPFGTQEQRIAFLEQPYPQQRDTLLAWIDNTWHMPGTQQDYVDKYWEIFEISNGFTERTVIKVDPQKEMQALIKGGQLGTFKPQFAPGYTQTPSIFDFKLDNREMVKSALGVDIGGIANTMTSSEAIRIGSIQKSLGKFNAQPSKWVTEMKNFVTGKTVKPGAGIMSLLEGSGIQTGTAEFAVRSLNQDLATGGRTAELLREIRAFGGINAAGQTSATAMYQLQRVRTMRGGSYIYDPKTGKREFTPNWVMESPVRASQAFYDEIREKDLFRNVGGFHAIQQGRLMFGGKITERSYGIRPGTASQRSIIKDTFHIRHMARLFGSDTKAQEELANIERLIQGEYEHDPIRAAMFLIRATEIANRRLDRIEKTVSDGLGIDFDIQTTGIGGWKHGDLLKQIRDDIQASGNVTIPSASRLESITLAFNENGSFSNFNNVDITGLSKEKLGITEQNVFDIRFNHTRGDRELLNRIRYIERIEAASSGTSPI
jgi:hypothetical protein